MGWAAGHCVTLHVGLEIGSLVEAAIADGTFVRRLLEMGDFVNS